MAHKVKVVPVPVRRYDRELACWISRVVGYRAVCADGYRGPVRRSIQEARLDLREHARSVESASDG